MPSKQFVSRLLAAVAVLGLMLGGITLAAAGGEKKGPEKISLKKIAKKKPPVVFAHWKHQADSKCKDCHHKWDGKAKVQTCTSCHEKPEKEGQPDLKKAFHKNCKSCHKKAKKADPAKVAPTKCKECHKKG